MILIEHTHQDGTTVTGTHKGDPCIPILKTHRLRWSRYAGAWYIPHSRDKDAQQGRINALADALRSEGYEVTVEIDNTRRDMAMVEAEKAERAEGRAQYYQSTGERLQQRSDARWEHNLQLWDSIPFGQPIMNVRDRNRREKLNESDRIAIRDQKAATHYTQRARSARATQREREDPRVTTRRIKRLQAIRTSIINQYNTSLWAAGKNGGLASEKKEQITASRDRSLEEIDEKISYWQQYLQHLEETGVWRPWLPEHFNKGDRVLVLGDWLKVLRANKKSLTVEHPFIPGDTTRRNYDEIRGRYRDGERITQAPARDDA